MATQYMSQTNYNNFNGAPGSSSVGNNNSGGGMGITTSSTPMYQTTSNFAPQAGGGSRIKVAVRIRPLLENERNQGHET